MFVVTFNKTTDAVLNLACHCEMHFHGITRHVSNLVDNEGMHGFVITVHREHADFNCYARERSRHFLVMCDR